MWIWLYQVKLFSFAMEDSGLINLIFLVSFPILISGFLFLWGLSEMATAQLTASSISTRNLPSFPGLRPSIVKVGTSVGHCRVGSVLSQRSFRGLVVKAATVVAPKVVFSLPYSVF